MPIFCILFCIFTMANIALPLTANFVGEFLIFQGAFCNNTLVTFLGATSMIFSGGYSLLAYGRVAYGACKPHFIRRCAVKAIISSLGNPLGAHSESWEAVFRARPLARLLTQQAKVEHKGRWSTKWTKSAWRLLTAFGSPLGLYIIAQPRISA